MSIPATASENSDFSAYWGRRFVHQNAIPFSDATPPLPRRRPGLTPVQLLVVMAIIGALITLLPLADKAARELAPDMSSSPR
jgi:hypothetical protein